jgi:soluble lytic murein transglycosylase-like protein
MICMRLAVATALCAGSLLPPVATAATVGRVFVSYAVDGSPRYASQRLDASYRVFIRGETVRTKSGKAPRNTSHVSQEQGRRQLTPLIAHFARLHQVEPELVAAVVAVESGFNTAAVSPAGAPVRCS